MNPATPYFTLMKDVEFGENPSKHEPDLLYSHCARVWEEYHDIGNVLLAREEPLVFLKSKQTARYRQIKFTLQCCSFALMTTGTS
ncbi:hypothetical protein TNCV_2777911 [Trichonephila clavipes]|nr:hypothetical protein TNCV_2777911 [Trichonephila clavipes]